MNNLTSLFGFLAALSLATERITEVVKGLPYVSKWLANLGKAGDTIEQVIDILPINSILLK
jgi:hypothetical protein